MIQSNKENLDNHIKNIQNNIQRKENKYLINISEDYINYIKYINSQNRASTKDFYIIIYNQANKNSKIESLNEIIENDLKEKFFKIKECLARCGNDVIEISNNEEITNLYYSFLNTRKSLNFNSN